MKFCPKCGAPRDDRNKVCHRCGTTVPAVQEDDPFEFEMPVRGGKTQKKKKSGKKALPIILITIAIVAVIALGVYLATSGVIGNLLNKQAEEKAPAADPPVTEAQVNVAPTEMATSYNGLVFSTTDNLGNEWNESVFTEHSLTMVNFWEYWCGPCVNEMPDLQLLLEKYEAEGFAIIGVYSSDDPDEIAAVQDATGVKYPLLRYVPAFDSYQTGYVPTTIFVNSAGEVVAEGIIGSKNLEDWSKIVEGLL